MLGVAGVIAVTLLAAAMAAFAQYLFKKDLRRFSFNLEGLLRIAGDRNVQLGLVVYALSLGVYLYALHATPVISFVYPVFASTFVFVLLISKFALKESINAYRLAGILLIIVGIVIISMTM